MPGVVDDLISRADELSTQRLREVLDYDHATGVFRWKSRTDIRACVNARLCGKVAGRVNSMGYIAIEINDKKYLAHRLAWLYMTGNWPSGEIDHVDRNPKNNRWANLRIATRQQNMANCLKANTHGYRGVKKLNRPYGKVWQADIRINGKRKYLGVFDTAEEAGEAYAKAAVALHGAYSVGCQVAS